MLESTVAGNIRSLVPISFGGGLIEPTHGIGSRSLADVVAGHRDYLPNTYANPWLL